MEDITFTIQIFSSVIALCCSYAFLMSILKKEHNTIWLRGEAVCTLLFSGIAFSLLYTNLTEHVSPYSFLSALALVLGLINALALVIMHRKKMQNDTAVYPESIVRISKLLGEIVFASITLHLLLQIAVLAWG